MKINKLVAENFGKLSGVEISLDDRVTVITGKNEAGKSSVASFIKYMLYGFVTSRSQSVADNEKKRYTPWQKESCNGEMLFTAKDGKKYHAMRMNAAKAQECLLDENEISTGIHGVGQHFFGVDEACYAKTAFIGESGVRMSDTGELDKAIRNMVVSGDEEIDSAKAIKKLDTVRKYYLGKTGRTGEILKLDEEIRELENTLERCSAEHKEYMSVKYSLEKISDNIAFNTEKKKKLDIEKQNCDALNAKNKLENEKKLREDMLLKKENLESFIEKIKIGNFVPDRSFASEFERSANEVCGDLRVVAQARKNVLSAKNVADDVYSDERRRKVSSASGDAEGVLEKALTLKKRIKTFTVLAVVFTVLIITFPLGILFFVKRNKVKKALDRYCRSFGCKTYEELEALVSGAESYRKMEKNAKDALDTQTENLRAVEDKLKKSIFVLKGYAEKCGLELSEMNTEEILETVGKHLEELKLKIEKCEEIKKEYGEACAAYKAFTSSINTDELKATALLYDESVETRSEEVVNRELAFYTGANDALSVKERELEKRLAVLSGTIPNPGELRSRIISLTGIRDDMRRRHKALETAITALENASEKVKKEASPLIASESGKIFSKITKGKYTALFADGEMNLSVIEKNGAGEIEAGYLSTGTLDTAYISLRIALCKYLYKETPVLVFDDAFSHMDDERLEEMLSFLWELSEEIQIVILSCHTRERDFFTGKAKLIDFKFN